MSFYRSKRVVVTGALGFIGSNLALQLRELGAEVTGIDSLVAGCGGNPLHGAGMNVVPCDIGDPQVADALRDADVVFNLAGEVSHTHSMLYPERDCRINGTAHLEFLTMLARVRPGVRVVYASTRQVYGVPASLPANEDLAVAAVDFNGVHKFAAEQYHQLLTRLGRLDAVVLRLTNIYGPRMAIGLACQGFLPRFTAQAVRGIPLKVFGSGEQLRDPLYVTDACEAFLRAGEVEEPQQRCFNIGSAGVLTLMDIAEVISREAGLPAPRLEPFPECQKRIDIGSYCTDVSSAETHLGWRAKVDFGQGMRETLRYYARHEAEYLQGAPGCPLGHLGGEAPER